MSSTIHWNASVALRARATRCSVRFAPGDVARGWNALGVPAHLAGVAILVPAALHAGVAAAHRLVGVSRAILLGAATVLRNADAAATLLALCR